MGEVVRQLSHVVAGARLRVRHPICARAHLKKNPERAVWDTDWPHPAPTGTMPDDGALVDAFDAYSRSTFKREQIRRNYVEVEFEPDAVHSSAGCQL